MGHMFYELADTWPEHHIALIPAALCDLYSKHLFTQSCSFLHQNAMCEVHTEMSSMHM
jgi:hypothetical protein